MRLLHLTDEWLQGQRDLAELVLNGWLRATESELGHSIVVVHLFGLLLLLMLCCQLRIELLERHVGQRELGTELDGNGVYVHRHHSRNSFRRLFLSGMYNSIIIRIPVLWVGHKSTHFSSFPLSQKIAMRSPVIFCFLGSVDTFIPKGNCTVLAGASTTSSVRRRSTTQFMRDLDRKILTLFCFPCLIEVWTITHCWFWLSSRAPARSLRSSSIGKRICTFSASSDRSSFAPSSFSFAAAVSSIFSLVDSFSWLSSANMAFDSKASGFGRSWSKKRKSDQLGNSHGCNYALPLNITVKWVAFIVLSMEICGGGATMQWMAATASWFMTLTTIECTFIANNGCRVNTIINIKGNSFEIENSGQTFYNMVRIFSNPVLSS